MMKLSLLRHGSDSINVLCLGAHSDDIEIGCGGTLLQLKKLHRNIQFHWVVFSAAGVRGREAKSAAGLFTSNSQAEVDLKEYRDGFFPYFGAEVKDSFEQVKSRIKPDLIFTHWGGDAHQDHRLVSELTWNTFRDHLILEYEIPKYDGDLGQPNVFFPLGEDLCNRKIELLLKAFHSQSNKRWFEDSTFRSLMRLRGMECNAPS